MQLSGKLQPLGQRIAVERLPERQEGSILKPDAYKEPGQLAKVIALGTGLPNFEFTVKPGDTVILPELFEPGEYSSEGTNLTICSERNLLAILDE
jgi:co-chaperonin GroES (HSP10)